MADPILGLRFGVLFMSEVFGAGLVREQHRDVVVGKVRRLELVHDADGLGLSFRNTEYRCF